MENISAGHLESFIVDKDKLYKQSKPQELNFYKELDNQENKYYKENQMLKQFCPIYYGQLIKDEKTYIILENLFYKMPYASSIDFKLGRQSYMAYEPQKKIESEKKKSKESTGDILGFRISGLQIKDNKGEIKKKLYKQEAYLTIKENDIEPLIIELLKSNEAKEINKQALDYFIEKIEKFINFFEEFSTRYFIATSVFLLCDNITNQYEIKLIDFGHYDELKSNSKDENVLEGLQSIMKTLKNIQKNY